MYLKHVNMGDLHLKNVEINYTVITKVQIVVFICTGAAAQGKFVGKSQTL